MKIAGTALFVLYACWGQQAAHWYQTGPLAWGDPVREWRVGIHTERQGYRGGEPLELAIAARNIGATKMYSQRQKSPWLAARYTILRAGDGEPLSLRPAKDRFDELRRLSDGAQGMVVEPGAMTDIGRVDLKKLFDMGPGTYTIKATVRLATIGRKEYIEVTSNEIVVSIFAN